MAPGVSEAERMVVQVAYNAVVRFYESGVFISESEADEVQCKAMLRHFWRIFESKMPSMVRDEIGDVTDKVNARFGFPTGHFVPSEYEDPNEEWTIRKRCVCIVEAFLGAMERVIDKHIRFVTDYCDDDGDQFYPRALWHAFFGKLSKTVRQAAFSVHEEYIRNFVYDRNVDEFETDRIPVGALFFQDEGDRPSLRRIRGAVLPPTPASPAAAPVERKRKRFFDTDSEDDEIIVPPAKSYRVESDVASAAHEALAEMVNDGSVVAVNNYHKFGVIGQWWDAFMQRLHPEVANGVASAYNFFRSQVQEQ